MSELSIFQVLNNVDISKLTKEKGKFKYLSWSNAVRESSKLFPDISWEMTKWDNLPYLKTELGYFVECTVKIKDSVKTQMMPVLDLRNQTLTAPKANDINKCQMRALTKAIALHGLGIDLWAGEDINGEYDSNGSQVQLLSIEQIDELLPLMCDENGYLTKIGSKVTRKYKVKNIGEIKESDFKEVKKDLSK